MFKDKDQFKEVGSLEKMGSALGFSDTSPRGEVPWHQKANPPHNTGRQIQKEAFPGDTKPELMTVGQPHVNRLWAPGAKSSDVRVREKVADKLKYATEQKEERRAAGKVPVVNIDSKTVSQSYSKQKRK